MPFLPLNQQRQSTEGTTLKYKYILQIKYTEAILSNTVRKLLWFEITEMLIAVKKINLLCYLL